MAKKRDPRFHVSFEFTCEVYRTKNKQFAYRIKSKNGKIVGQGETYTRKYNCMKTVNRVFDWMIEGEFMDLKDLTLK